MKNPIKKVAAIHDLSGYGRASLTVIIPLMSTMGIQVCPMPTAVLSSHTKFPNPHFIDLTADMPKMIARWKDLGLEFDAIYSGFLGSPRQIDIVKDFIADFGRKGALVVVDPVLGDSGALYSSFDYDMVLKMRELVAHAQIITPNLTEVNLLLDEPHGGATDLETLKAYCVRLSQQGPETVIITSIPEQHNRTAVLAYERVRDKFWKVSCDYIPTDYPGTGDGFASIITASLLQGDSLPMALDRAVHFISLGVRATYGYEYDPREGILFERVLPSLNAPIQVSSYEII